MTFIPYRDFPSFPKALEESNPHSSSIQEDNQNQIETIGSSDIESALQVQKLTESAKTPMRQTNQAAGYDIYSAEATQIEPDSRKLIKTDIAIAIPEGTYARIAARSGLAAKYSIDVGAGVIDADFRGEVKVLLINNTMTPANSIASSDDKTPQSSFLTMDSTPSLDAKPTLSATVPQDLPFPPRTFTSYRPNNLTFMEKLPYSHYLHRVFLPTHGQQCGEGQQSISINIRWQSSCRVRNHKLCIP